jgi:hypothetical protein
LGFQETELRFAFSEPGNEVGEYGWMPHNAGFGFLDWPRGVLGQIHFLDRF